MTFMIKDLYDKKFIVKVFKYVKIFIYKKRFIYNPKQYKKLY